nr:glycosyltransferase family 1 protein [Bacteroides intestinalis]
MKLHVVSFQVPFPPDYGGLIDVYYKLKALKEAGYSVVLHTYRYGVDEQPDLLKVADTVYYYERLTGWLSMFSFLPYIVYSRRSKLLLERLCEDNSPILFEGLHTCYFLSNPLLRDRPKWVRMHNVEHDYYNFLGKSCVSWHEKCYYYLEAWKLKHYERVLLYANKILAITHKDAGYFTQKYPSVLTYCLPCFFDSISVKTVRDVSIDNGKYILYHGNLSVLENIRVINYILDNLVSKLDIGMQVIIAGKNPCKHLQEKISRIPNVSLIANPSQEEMNFLIASAHIHLLLTFQDTGIKLKLIYSLMKGHGHCLVNSMMIPDSGFEEVCTIADGQEAQVIALRELYHTPLMPEALQWRQQALTKMGYNNQVTLILH